MLSDSLATRLLGAERRFRRFQQDGAATAIEPQGPSPAEAAQLLHQVVQQVGDNSLGKEGQVRITLACVLACCHLLIEEIPGVGKTLLAHALASSLGLKFQRIQFTIELLPADI